MAPCCAVTSSYLRHKGPVSRPRWVLGGVPLVRAPEAAWRLLLSIARERHTAAEWLLGQDPDYSEVTADT